MALHTVLCQFPTLLSVAIGFAFTAFFVISLYNLFLHPLRSFPGPWYTRASALWYLSHSIRGNVPRALHYLHLKYGPVLRIAPDQLSYTDARAWKDIYGYRPGAPENRKDPSQNTEPDREHPSILNANRAAHTRTRQLLAPAFSDKALREQEGLIAQYVHLLLKQLSNAVQNGEDVVDIVKWYNYTTFDIIGHLALAEPFDCLSQSTYHPWVATNFAALKFTAIVRAINRCVSLGGGAARALVQRWFISPQLVRQRAASYRLTCEKLERRRAQKPQHIDFLTHLLAAEARGDLEPRDLISNASLLVVAGSETTATLLSGATYFLLSNPRVYAKLAHEVRSAFASAADISLSRANGLKYMLAVLDEALRLYPPATGAHPRRTPPEGATVLGQRIPSDCVVGICHYPMFRSPANFAEPETFAPERFVDRGDPRWARDRREALQPFSFGPRNCIGRNLAYVEMRLIIAHLLFHFDMELMPEARGWDDQKSYVVWEKKPLLVKLKQRKEIL